MTKSELIKRLERVQLEQAQQDRLDRETVILVVNTLLEGMSASLARGERIEIRDFGNFSVRRYAAGTRRNPKTGAVFQVAERYRVFFRPGKELGERVEAAAAAERSPEG